MLKRLSITNYALIENLEIEFPNGLVIITGETGAGKSVLMGAVSLLLGGKADAAALKDSAKNCVVEAEFLIESDSQTSAILSSEGIDDHTTLIIRRIVSSNGKSRSFINDMPVTVQLLKELSGKIVDIHAQHQHLLLGDSNFQMTVLDSFCKNKELLESYREKHELCQDLRSQYKELKSQSEKSAKENEYNKFMLDKLIEAKLDTEEFKALEDEFSLLSNAEEIKSSLFGVTELFNPAGISIVHNLKEAVNTLNKITGKYSKCEHISSRIEECRLELKDIELELSTMSESIDVSPERIQIIEERLSSIYDLMQRHKVDTIDALIDIKAELEKAVAQNDSFSEQLEQLTAEITLAETMRESLAIELSDRRKISSKEFAEEISNSVKELEMPYAQFIVDITDSDSYNIFGKNIISCQFSANKNVPPRDLSRVASGGELSRIMLCLKALMAKNTGMPSMIFDEIDTGVSGSIADKMGNLIDELSNNMQVFAITHLPQIASKGQTHLLVYKEIDTKGATVTRIKEIKDDERVLEIARMLSGAELTAAAKANAQELLKVKVK